MIKCPLPLPHHPLLKKKKKNLVFHKIHKKQVICRSDHKAAKILWKDSVFKKMEAYSFSKKRYFCKYTTLVVINNNLWKLRKKKKETKYNAIIQYGR